MKPTVLLTGGFGNLGGRLAASLHLAGNWNIRLASRTHRHAPSWAPDAEVVHLDLLNNSGVLDACKGADSVIHLAALNDREAIASPELAAALSGTGTQLLADAAAAQSVERFLFMSTSHVYGSPLEGTINESSSTHCTHPYATSHLAGEHVVQTKHELGQLLGFRIRCANGFGFPMDPSVNIWHVLVYDLCRQVASHGTMTLNSSGVQRRNFIPVTDICSAMTHFLTLDQTSIDDGLFNLGGPSSHSVLEMAEKVASRSKAVLGIDPQIFKPEASPAENYGQLDYQISKLVSTGFNSANNVDFEIDRLLTMCQELNL
jgi:UDP-glucose 4-epimerase